MKVFVQGVKRSRGAPSGLGEKHQKKAILLFFSVVIPAVLVTTGIFLNNLGEEKSQNLEYFRPTFLEFNLTEVPRMIPMHHFSFFDTQEIQDRIRCKIFEDKFHCLNIERKRCLSKGIMTEKYELCMIDLEES